VAARPTAEAAAVTPAAAVVAFTAAAAVVAFTAAVAVVAFMAAVAVVDFTPAAAVADFAPRAAVADFTAVVVDSMAAVGFTSVDSMAADFTAAAHRISAAEAVAGTSLARFPGRASTAIDLSRPMVHPTVRA
jgi:hypothetical protein